MFTFEDLGLMSRLELFANLKDLLIIEDRLLCDAFNSSQASKVFADANQFEIAVDVGVRNFHRRIFFAIVVFNIFQHGAQVLTLRRVRIMELFELFDIRQAYSEHLEFFVTLLLFFFLQFIQGFIIDDYVVIEISLKVFETVENDAM